jgi:hypothetical protein
MKIQVWRPAHVVELAPVYPLFTKSTCRTPAFPRDSNPGGWYWGRLSMERVPE